MAWTQQLNIKGPKGDPGKDGAGVNIVGTLTAPQRFADITSKQQGDMYLCGNPVPTDSPASKDGPALPGDGVAWTGTTWVNVGQIRGPKGDKGDTGPAGPIGDDGPTGPPGPKGDTGPAGAKGDQGPVGPQGDPGAKGDTGAQGPQGAQGPKGDIGPKGDTGPAGAQGPQGPRGAKWFAGDGPPSTVPDAMIGDYYLDRLSGDIYELLAARR